MTLTFPTLVTRAQKGAPLLDSEMDANLTNIKAFCLTLANLLTSALNPDGTLVAGSVNANALQAAAVTLAALNPALLYSMVPVDTDTGTANAYAITARGGAGGKNIVPAGAAYDANGNYVLAGLVLNYGYFWEPGAGDLSCAPADQTPITAADGGAFTAAATSVTLTGTPLAAVTASVAQSAPISGYANGQMFFVYTANANTSSATLSVNNIGPVPITLNGQPLVGGDIPADSVFAVAYLSGAFVLFGGGGNGAGATSSTQYTINNTVKFASGNVNLPGAAGALQVAHGLNTVPTSVQVLLLKTAADGTALAVGEYVPAGQFNQSLTVGAPAFTIGFDAANVYVAQANDTPAIGGTAITAASWAMVVVAVAQGTTSNTVFPALTYSVACPEGAFSCGTNLVVFTNGQASGIVRGSAINLTNNETTALTPPNTGNPQLQNHAPWTRASGVGYSLFSSNAGIYQVPLANPQANIVPAASVYSAGGICQILTFVTGTAYTITKGQNDISYSVDGGVTYVNFPSNTPSVVSLAAGNTFPSLYLKGTANSTVSALVAGASSWLPTQLSTATGLSAFKPVWMTEAGGAPTMIYLVASNYAAGAPVNAISMRSVTISGETTTVVGTLDFTNSGIANVAAFNAWCPAANTSRVLFFQYNALSGRIYLQTNETGLLHIFQISATYGNNIAALWALGANAYANLTYVKTLAIAAGEAYAGSDGNSNNRRNLTIEVDQATGLEQALVFTSEGVVGSTGTVQRVPWVE